MRLIEFASRSSRAPIFCGRRINGFSFLPISTVSAPIAWTSTSTMKPSSAAFAEAFGANAPFEHGSCSADAVTPHKPLSDTRSYRSIELPNCLKVLLISEPNADKAAAALTTAVGHLSDPPELAGLSHFLEHMLFLGTEKYPDESSYKKFLKDHGGGSNASTSAEATTYHFYIHHNHLEPALDHFGSFFRSPLFTPSATDRELNAVDSENSKNLNDDGRRAMQVQKHLSNPLHVYTKFGTGNMSTLRTCPAAAGIDVREALLKHYNTYYSSNIMALSVIGRQSLDELESIVRGKGAFNTDFSAVRNLNIAVPVHNAGVHPYQRAQLCKAVYITPVKDIRSISLTWPIPSPPLPDYSKSERYLSHLIGHEGAGSILSLLKAKGWATALSAGASWYRHFSTFYVDINVTPAGLEHRDEVIRMVYQYIAMLRQQDGTLDPEATGPSTDAVAAASAQQQQDAGGVWRPVYDELRQVASNAVRFKPQTPPVSAVTAAVSSLQLYPGIDVMVAPSLLGPFDPPGARRTLACLTPRNALVATTAKLWGEEAGKKALADAHGATLSTLTEPAYGFQYQASPLSQQQLDLWGAGAPAASLSASLAEICGRNDWDLSPATLPLHDDLRLPEVNEFIPSDFAIKFKPASGSAGAAVSVVDDAASGAVPAGVVPPPDAVHDPQPGKAEASMHATVDAISAPPTVAGAGTSNSAQVQEAAALQTLAASAPAVAVPGSGTTTPDAQIDVIATPAASEFEASPATPSVASAAVFTLPPHALDQTEVSTGASQPVMVTIKYPEPTLLSIGTTVTEADKAQLSALEAMIDNGRHAESVVEVNGVMVSRIPVRLWLKQDSKFLLPKTFIISRIKLPRHKALNVQNGKNRVLAHLYSSMLNDMLNEVTYAAQGAGLSYELIAIPTANAIGLSVFGYSHKLPVLLQRVLDELVSFPTAPDDVLQPVFDRRLEARKRALANFSKARPDSRAVAQLDEYLLHPYVTQEAALMLMEGVTLNDVRAFATGLFDTCSQATSSSSTGSSSPTEASPVVSHGCSIEMFIYGNCDEGDARNLSSMITTTLGRNSKELTPTDIQALTTSASAGTDLEPTIEGLPTASFLEQKGVFLRPGSDVVITRPHPNSEERNTAVHMQWQTGVATPRTRALAQLLSMLFSQPAFDTLRTKEQLGYIVFAGSSVSDDGCIIQLFVTVQSSNSSVEYVQSRIEAFILAFRGQLAAMSDDEISAKARILADRLTETDKTQSSEANRIWEPIAEGSYDFHAAEAVAAAVLNVKHADLLTVYDAAVMPGGASVRRSVSRVYSTAQAAPADAAAQLPGETPAASPAAAAAAAAVQNDGGPSKLPSPHPHEVTADPLLFKARVIGNLLDGRAPSAAAAGTSVVDSGPGAWIGPSWKLSMPPRK